MSPSQFSLFFFLIRAAVGIGDSGKGNRQVEGEAWEAGGNVGLGEYILGLWGLRGQRVRVGSWAAGVVWAKREMNSLICCVFSFS